MFLSRIFVFNCHSTPACVTANELERKKLTRQ